MRMYNCEFYVPHRPGWVLLTRSDDVMDEHCQIRFLITVQSLYDGCYTYRRLELIQDFPINKKADRLQSAFTGFVTGCGLI